MADLFTDRILDLVRQGKPFREVADLCGVTKNVVAGKVHRAEKAGVDLTGKNPQHRHKPAVEMPAEPPPRKKMTAAARQQAAAAQAAIKGRTPPDAPKPASVERQAAPVITGAAPAVVALRDWMCRFPIGEVLAEDFRFCCERVAATGAPPPSMRFYCPAHRRLALANPGENRDPVLRTRIAEAAHG